MGFLACMFVVCGMHWTVIVVQAGRQHEIADDEDVASVWAIS
jgi:hypothetical protein